jgi:cytosine/adenosine deaminase-related metal-dependent hydrolase
MVSENLTTIISKASWVIYWDGEKNRHRYGRDLDVVFQGNTIQYVGSEYRGKADRRVDGSNLLVMPGLVDLHSHLFGGSVDKGVFDDIGAKALYGHALYTYSPLLQVWEEEGEATVEGALCELLQSGATTVVDISRNYPGKLELMDRSGLRVYVGESFRQARWIDVEGRAVEYQWNEEAGWEGLSKAIRTVEALKKHPSGRLQGIIMPAQADTCKADLIKEAFKQAQNLEVPFHIHAAQTLIEVHEIVRRHGISPVQWLEELEVLSSRTTLGHCIFVDHHPGSPFRSEEDLSRLAHYGVTVAHCPTVFARTGMTLHTFGKYRKAGVNLGIGTDSYPYNMLEEIRNTILFARTTGRSVFDTSTSEAFHAATVGGARALLRDDLGRIAPGCKADLVLVDLSHPSMQPVHDPLRSLVYVAADRAVRDVYIDGNLVLKDGRVLTLDWTAGKRKEQEVQNAVLQRVPRLDPKGRTILEIAPLSLD